MLSFIQRLDQIVWGPVMLALLVGTGIILNLRMNFLPVRNLGFALKCVFGKEARIRERKEGDITPLSALTTALAATIGTGNIVGVATAMVLGGPGALVWMWISAFFGLATKFTECMLAVKYREKNRLGEMCGGPMYVMKNGLKNKRAGRVMAGLFAFFTVAASFGIGNMTQANSISEALSNSFDVPPKVTGLVIMALSMVIILGGIETISRVSQIIVPVMALFYVSAGLVVILLNVRQLLPGLADIFCMAFSPRAAACGAGGMITASMAEAARWGVARGVFSNEAGLGSAAITAAAAATDEPVKQGYISMTGTFFDTLVVCTVTGLVIACSGVLGIADPSTGQPLTGAALTIAAFQSALGSLGSVFICLGIVLFAFSTILGWEYQGEKAFEYLSKSPKMCMVYRILFSGITFTGATMSLQEVWSFADVANGLMAVPNLICLLLLSGKAAKEIREFHSRM